MRFCVYIIFSQSFDKYYIGYTGDFEQRLLRHNSGSEKSTAPYCPWVLKCLIHKETKTEALVLEKKLKNLNRKKLLAFIEKYAGRID